MFQEEKEHTDKIIINIYIYAPNIGAPQYIRQKSTALYIGGL